MFGRIGVSSAKAERGFTLIELLVVTGIMVVISGVMLSSNARFGGAITLRNLAYDVALSVREAQIYGISVRRFGVSDFTSGYGMHFRTSDPTSYKLFADAKAPSDGLYSGKEELVENLSIGRGFSISDLCVTIGTASTETCGISKIDILFKRPEPDAHIRYNDGTSLNQRARIQLSSPRGDVASVLVEATGQISVQ
jgi:prepilin-type N-terminal cleavage/methylation domain-containing protein